MKFTLISLTIFSLMVFLSCSSSNKPNQNENSPQNDSIQRKNDNTAVSKTPNYSDTGLELLLKLAESKDGWHANEITGESSTFKVHKEGNLFIANWNSVAYIVGEAEEGMIGLYSKEAWNSAEFTMANCYSITFTDANIFEMGYFDQCARLDEDQGHTTYKKVGATAKAEVFTGTKGIQNILNKITNTYYEAEKTNDDLKQTCTVYKLSVEGHASAENCQHIWLDCVMDGYELKVTKAETTEISNNYRIYCESSSISNCISSQKTARIEFAAKEGHDVAIIHFDGDDKPIWFVNKETYNSLSEPSIPCEEEGY